MAILSMNMDKHTVCLQIIVILVSILRSVALTDEVHLVVRRFSGDIAYYYYNSSSGFWFHLTCINNNYSTFLVNDRRCITNEELFNGNNEIAV